MKKLILFIAAFFMVFSVAACNKTPDTTLSYTVTFDTDGGSAVPSQTVQNGDKVTKPADPTKDGYVFSGTWMNGDFEWNFDVDIVTSDITLTAVWVEVSALPTNIQMTTDPFSSVITWQEQDASSVTFTVSLKPEDGDTFTELPGTVNVTTGDVVDTVTFTPTDLPQGGYYIVKVDVVSDAVTTTDALLFAGAGTEANPYLASKVADIVTILDDSTYWDKDFQQVNDILMTLSDTIEVTDARKVSFDGIYDGGNYSLSFTGNGGLFHEITANGVVKNVVIDSTTQLSASDTNQYAIGVIADTNNGLIQNIATDAKIVNAALQGDLPVYDGTINTEDNTTGAGGIVGINGTTGTVDTVVVTGAGAVKAGRGVGGVAAYNYGTIENAIVTATLPAGNQANSGKSSNTYSYGGGIAGFNFGTISQCTVGGRVFAQSAYSTTGDGNEGKNVAFGGIAGYNSGLITESSFARSMDVKEFIDKTRATELNDSANNLGVASIHGDLYIGGIAGINAGQIEYSYVGGALIGGRDYVGGVSGLTLGSGSINNTYVFAEIAIKDDSGAKITEATNKTTDTTYEIAPSGFDAATTFYAPLINSESGNTWVPGDLAQPQLPEFTADDYAIVGDHFTANGLLTWQTGIVTGVDITLDTLVIQYMAQETIEYTITPSDAPDIFTTWSSSDENIIRIVGEGIIKAVGVGTATVTVTTRDGGYTDSIEVTVEDYTQITSVTVYSDEFTLPEANNADDRPDVAIGTMITFNADILPLDASYQDFTLSSSNSRAVVDGHTVTFVYGNTGPGKVSITVTFVDSSVAPLEYRFMTYESTNSIPISSASVTCDAFTMPEANNPDATALVAIGTSLALTVNIEPTNATVQTYTITTSNTNATVDGNTVTFVSGDAGPGDVSVIVTFDDPDATPLEYRFHTYEVTAAELTLPQVNNADVRPYVVIGTSLTLSINGLPEGTTYTISTSNSRAEAVDNVVTFVYGSTGPGKVSVYVTFDDTTIQELNFRFSTFEVTCAELTLPQANNADDRLDVNLDTTITLVINGLGDGVTYTVTTSNSRAEATGDSVTFVYGNTGPGKVSIYITFDDPTMGVQLNYRFTTVDPNAA